MRRVHSGESRAVQTRSSAQGTHWLFDSGDSLANIPKLYQKPKNLLASFTNTKAPLLGPIFCISFFAYCCDKCQLRKEEAYFRSHFEGTVHTDMDGMEERVAVLYGGRDSHVASSVRMQRAMNAGVKLTPFHSPGRGMDVPLTSGETVLCSVKPFWKHIHGHSQK